MTQATRAKRHRGRMAQAAGAAAELQVSARYQKGGSRQIEQRWRGQAGEIDLIFDDDETLIFVEVKKARSFDAALNSLRQRQITRICQAAEEYAGAFDGQREMRFDLALVDDVGRVHAMENVLAMG